MRSNTHAHLLYSWAIPMNVSAPAIALRRLARANELLLEIVTSLYDEQASRWASPTAASAKWHLCHVAHWSDIVQSALLPLANGQTCRTRALNSGMHWALLTSVNSQSLCPAREHGGILTPLTLASSDVMNDQNP